jgi:hypothetical protein
MIVTDLKTFIEEVKYLHRSSQETNAHTMEHSVSIGDYDVIVYGSFGSIKLLVYQDIDTDRLHPVVRFEYVRYPSIKALQVVLAVWDFCRGN